MHMRKLILLPILVFMVFQARAADYYWVGGGGNWSDLNHWRLGSTAGPIPSIIPSIADNVFFTAGAGFTAVSKTVTLDADGFCNNMTWSSVPNSPTFNAANASFTLEVRGDMVLSPITTYNVQFDLRGGTANTLTTGGTGLGAFTLNIDKPGGGLTVTDSLVCPGAVNIALVSGGFNAAGKKLYVFTFISTSGNTRSLDISNSNATVGYQYHYTGANKTLNAAGSTLYAIGYLFTDGGTYNRVYNDAFGSNNFGISNTIFSYLNFRAASAGSYAGIGNNNTVLDSLIFAGRGSIGGSNTIGRVVFGMSGSIGGGNIIDYLRVNRGFGTSGTNTIDSLLLGTNYPSTLNGTLNINGYLYLNGQSCDAFTEVSGDSVNGAINFASGAVVDINNMILTGVRAFGPATPIAVTGIDNGGNVGFAITPPTASGTTLYWVGGAGDWNDRTHWSTSSGGSGGACVPFIADDVVFDANSGLAAGTVTTSSSSFCRNMTWANIGTVTFNESATSSLRMYGSLIMDNSVTMNAFIECWGAAADTITTNGSTAGSLQFILQKTGSGGITLADNWSNPTGGSFVHRSGSLNLSGRTVNLAYYTSTINSVRSLDITNATLNLTDYDYRGTGKTIASTGSHITTTRGVAVDGLTYPWVDANYEGTGSYFDINNTTFGQLTFNATSTTVNADIEQGNTIRRLEYKGKGIITGGGNTIDSLILAGSRNYFFAGTNTITQYLKAQSAPCTGLGEIRNYAPAGATGTLNFSTGAVVDMANVYLQNIIATGPITPVAFSGADAGGNSGWNITVAPGGPRYWIGGAGDWNDAVHWSTTSGGTGGACIPTVYDDVYFDANSGFTAVSKTVTVNNGNAYCRNLNWTGASNNPVWSKSASFSMEVWGDSVILNPNATFNVAPLILKGPNTAYMNGGAPAGNFDVTIDKTGGSLTLLNNYSNASTDFVLQNGAFNAPGRTLNVSGISNSGLANASSVNISGATITTGTWTYTGATTNHSLTATNATINATAFNANGFTYNKVNVSGTLNTSAQLSSCTIDSLIFTNPSTVSAVGINGTGNTLSYVEYKGSGGIYGTGNTIDTLIFFPGANYTLNAGTNTTITGEWFGSGTPCHLTQIYSSSTTTNATVTKTSGDVNFDYVRLRRITAAGTAAPFIGREHTDNQGNNTNWNIAPYNGAAPIYGLGPDTLIAPGDFPYVLRTDGFFGSPSSLYAWTGGSTADTFIAPGPGTYRVNVSFVDGCNISDSITLAYYNPLPLTLIGFNAWRDGQQVQLKWFTADERNVSHFDVERSSDGKDFASIGRITAKNNTANEYNHADHAPLNGTGYYRIKMIDHDGRHAYSPVRLVRSSDEHATVQVYPVPARDEITVSTIGMPPVSLDVRIYSQTGQLLKQETIQGGSIKKLDVSTLGKGAYMLRLLGNDGYSDTFSILIQ